MTCPPSGESTSGESHRSESMRPMPCSAICPAVGPFARLSLGPVPQPSSAGSVWRAENRFFGFSLDPRPLMGLFAHSKCGSRATCYLPAGFPIGPNIVTVYIYSIKPQPGSVDYPAPFARDLLGAMGAHRYQVLLPVLAGLAGCANVAHQQETMVALSNHVQELEVQLAQAHATLHAVSSHPASVSGRFGRTHHQCKYAVGWLAPSHERVMRATYPGNHRVRRRQAHTNRGHERRQNGGGRA